ncbi:hypothetical protein [Vibrio gazogenes]|uniref:Uncharacterized protein n=1 Tax=Vibrio gazogenes DSM 21264 = NBRC 103151 TaxID=1123492 RepID=A0A1M4ZML8_VIBGA|nr:hypothetical protein [Vibrio gazogenes]USP15162.1 hypothetical protein MKS89_07660 [Vibrio gazogenes]SHF19289.1 hypothetical protein SAMN02745781_01673 [Vibrio gazogenes DSM 21264] [Vibrio gazogenes DSM 21264 = NBRC 103151]
MIKVSKHDAITLKISHEMSKSKLSSLEMYLFVPGEIGLNQDLMPETDLYYNCLTQKRAYYSDKHLLPLIHSRLAQRGRLSSTQYRISLSLFAYQYVMALDNAVGNLLHDSDNVTETEIDNVVELTLDILRRLRRTIPYEETLKRYYTNIDNYLSWYTEQKFLSLVAHLTRDSEYKTIKDRLIILAEKEQAHRALHHYNSDQATQDITRISNKMRLLRRLIEHPVILKETLIALGNNIRRIVKGIATGFVMLFVTMMVVFARDYWGEITASFIIAMSFIYALREIFKDDLKDMLWRWLRKGKPKWKRRYYDPSTGKQIGQKYEWLNYQTISNLPDRIQRIRKKRIVQREEQVISYRSETEMSTSRFMSGYEETRETIYFDFREITRLFDKDTYRVYRLNNGQVSREKIEKRHLFNLIIKQDNHIDEPIYYRWKVVLNRSKIVAIEPIELTSNELE